MRRALPKLINSNAGALDSRDIDFADQLARELEFVHPNNGGVKRIRFDDVGPGCQVFAMNLADIVGPSETKQITEPRQVFMVAVESLAADRLFRKAERLDHRTHRAVEDQYAILQQ
jgi:chromosomal replication initiation ATPase DnaA